MGAVGVVAGGIAWGFHPLTSLSGTALLYIAIPLTAAYLVFLRRDIAGE
jgi:hypothetical protein